jgi:hypothetical protein
MFDAEIVSKLPILLMFDAEIVSNEPILAILDAVIVSILFNLLFVEAVKVLVVPTLEVNNCNVEIFASADAVYVFKSAVVANPNPLTTTEPVTCKL